MIHTLTELLEFARTQETIALSFSRGIDSTAAWIVLREVCDIRPVYLLRYPELLQFEATDLARFEDHFGTQITTVLDANTAELIYSWIWQDLDGRSAIEPVAPELKQYGRNDNDTLIRAAVGDLYIAKGISVFDSPQRRAHLRQTGMVFGARRVIYPIAHMSRSERARLVAKAGSPTATEYEALDHTCDTVLYDHLEYIRAHHPQDFERLRFWYPFIEAEIKRYEYSHH